MHVFLSYSRADQAALQALKNRFTAADIPIWCADFLTPDDRAWPQTIESALDEAACVVVLCSPEAKASKWIALEIAYGRALGKPVIPLLMRGEIADAIPDSLRNIPPVDLRADTERIQQDLIHNLRVMLKLVIEPAAYSSSGPQNPRFTPAARHTLALAQGEAERMRHMLIGPEHLLLGLFIDETSRAAQILRGIVSEQRLKHTIEGIVPPDRVMAGTPTDLSPALKRVLELAVDEARRQGMYQISSEHLLLGLLRLRDDNLALDALNQLGLNPKGIAQEVKRSRKRRQPPARFRWPGKRRQ